MTSISESKTQLEAEMIVIWYYLYRQKASPLVSTVGPEHFVAAAFLGEWWEKARELAATNKPINLLEISRPNHDAYKAIDDFMTVATPDTMVHTENMMRDGAALHHAEIGAEDWLYRARNDEDATLEELHAAFGEIAARFQVGEDIEPETWVVLAKRVGDRFLEKDLARGIPIPILGDKLRHFKFKKFYLVGGLTSNHKTTFALQCVEHAAKAGYKTLIWTLEDDNDFIAERIFASKTKLVTLDHFERGVMSGDSDVISEIAQVVDDSPNVTPMYFLDEVMSLSKLIAQVSRMVYKFGIKMVVVDFMQMIDPDDPRMLDQQVQTKSSQALAALAKRLDIVIIGVVQLTQAATLRAVDGDAPRTGDIRGTSAIAQAAYGVIMCHRPDAAKAKAKAKEEGKPDLPEGKQRLQLWVRKWKRANLSGVDCFVDAAHDRLTPEPGSGTPSRKKFYSTS